MSPPATCADWNQGDDDSFLPVTLAQAEEAALKVGRVKVADGPASYPVWNHWEFRVAYPSLARQLCVGGIYVKLLLDGLDQVRAVHEIERTCIVCSAFCCHSAEVSCG